MAVDLRAAVALRARGGAAHAPAARRPHHQLLRLGGAQRPAALSGIPDLLRRQGGRHRADRSAGAGTGARSDPGQRHRPGTDRRAGRYLRRRVREGRAGDAAWPVGRRIENRQDVLALVDSDFITGETIRVDGGRHLK